MRGRDEWLWERELHDGYEAEAVRVEMSPRSRQDWLVAKWAWRAAAAVVLAALVWVSFNSDLKEPGPPHPTITIADR